MTAINEIGNKYARLTVLDRLPIDHCHTTNKVRGVLCTKCNQALGMMDDDTDRLAKAIQYLHKSYS